MPKDYFIKQNYEEFYISGDFSDVLATDETITLASSSVTAVDTEGTDVTSSIIDSGSEAVSGDTLVARVKGGTTTGSPYKITFKISTNLGNKWELDVLMKVEDI